MNHEPGGTKMPSESTGRNLPLIGGGTRNFAAGMMYAGIVVMFILAIAISWPLGSNFVDEGGITKIRLAIAFLAVGHLWALIFVGFFLFDILKRLRELSDRLDPTATGQAPDDE